MERGIAVVVCEVEAAHGDDVDWNTTRVMVSGSMKNNFLGSVERKTYRKRDWLADGSWW